MSDINLAVIFYKRADRSLPVRPINRYLKPELPELYVPVLQTPRFIRTNARTRASSTGWPIATGESEIKHESASASSIETRVIANLIKFGCRRFKKAHVSHENANRALVTKYFFATRDLLNCVHIALSTLKLHIADVNIVILKGLFLSTTKINRHGETGTKKKNK